MTKRRRAARLRVIGRSLRWVSNQSPASGEAGAIPQGGEVGPRLSRVSRLLW